MTNRPFSPSASISSAIGLAATTWTPDSSGELQAPAYIDAPFGPVYVFFKASVAP
jgi:hypothetical protein